jgi:hypothetical protein
MSEAIMLIVFFFSIILIVKYSTVKPLQKQLKELEGRVLQLEEYNSQLSHENKMLRAIK